MLNFKISYTGSSKLLHRICEKLNQVPILGTNHEDAYYGDQGEEAWQHSLLREGNPHQVSLADLGIESLPRQIETIQSAIGLETPSWVFHGSTADERIPVIDHEGSALLFRSFRSLLAWH